MSEKMCTRCSQRQAVLSYTDRETGASITALCRQCADEVYAEEHPFECDTCGWDNLDEYACPNNQTTCVDCCPCSLHEYDGWLENGII